MMNVGNQVDLGQELACALFWFRWKWFHSYLCAISQYSLQRFHQESSKQTNKQTFEIKAFKDYCFSPWRQHQSHHHRFYWLDGNYLWLILMSYTKRLSHCWCKSLNHLKKKRSRRKWVKLFLVNHRYVKKKKQETNLIWNLNNRKIM